MLRLIHFHRCAFYHDTEKLSNRNNSLEKCSSLYNFLFVCDTPIHLNFFIAHIFSIMSLYCTIINRVTSHQSLYRTLTDRVTSIQLKTSPIKFVTPLQNFGHLWVSQGAPSSTHTHFLHILSYLEMHIKHH